MSGLRRRPPPSSSSSSSTRPQPRATAAANTDLPNDLPGADATRSNTGLTWQSFLQQDEAALEHQARISADRKRRHDSSSSPERRTNPYNPTYTSLTTRPAPSRPLQPPFPRPAPRPAPGSSSDNAIDLTSPPGAPIMSRARPVAGVVAARQSYMAERRESEVVLPAWQADADVTECFVCHIDFSFWNRRHHCRKCGRVVCSNCSPHRITIPHQYIVRPPTNQAEDAEPPSPALRGLGGGETVRVCNPCVPDPWMPPASPGIDSREALMRRLTESREHIRRGHETIAARQIAAEPLEPARQRSERYRYPHPPLPQQASRGRTSSLSNYSQSMPRLAPQPSNHFTGDGRLPGYNRPPPVPPSSSRPSYHRYSHSQAGGSVHLPDDVIFRRPLNQIPRPPRREVKEEDECPVCGQELPPGDETRAAHVSQCVESRFSSTPSQSTASAPPQASALSTSFPAPPTDSQPRARGMSFKSRGMAVYRASEKDCTTASGEAQECVICFEEFQAGDEMGRMECLCKFHRVCIRQWWDTKGAGSCPTHQLQE